MVSVFFGIIVRMWHDDHPPPHIHVEFQGFEALMQIQTGPVSKGKLPRKVAAIVQEWCLSPSLTPQIILLLRSSTYSGRNG